MWKKLPNSAKDLVQQCIPTASWALKLQHLALLGSFGMYPKLSPQIVNDLDFARRLRCYVSQAFSGFSGNVRNVFKLCLNNLEKVEKRQKQTKAQLAKIKRTIQSAENQIELSKKRQRFS